MKSSELLPRPIFTLPGKSGNVELALWGDLHVQPPGDFETNTYLSGFITELSALTTDACIDLGDMVDKGNTNAVAILEKILEDAMVIDHLYLLNNGNHDISMITGDNVYKGSKLQGREMVPGKEYVISGENAAITIMMVNSFIGHAKEKELLQVSGQKDRLEAYHDACDELILPSLKESLENRSQSPIILLLHYPLFNPTSNSQLLGDQKHLSESCVQTIDETKNDGRGSIIAVFHAHHHGGSQYKFEDLYHYTKAGIPLINVSGRARAKIGLPFITRVQINFQEKEEKGV